MSRPRIHRSKITAAVGGISTHQRAELWGVLCGCYDDEPPAGLLEGIERACAAYKADRAALSLKVSTAAEADDLAAIASECRELAPKIPEAVEHITEGTRPGHGADAWPRALCVRLHDRLEQFPPQLDAAMMVDGVDLWPVVRRLHSSVLRPALWADDPSLPADLLRLADACDRAPRLPVETKPHNVARDRFKAAIAELQAEHPPQFDNATTRAGMLADLIEALDAKSK